MPPDRWFAVGSADTSADDAGWRAADAALIHDGAKLLIVFCSPPENLPDLIGQIIRGAYSVLGAGVPMVGDCDSSVDALGGFAPLGMIAFDYVARRGVLGQEGIEKEIHGLADAAGGAPLAGFYSYGEIARTHGMRDLHNYTLVLLSVA